MSETIAATQLKPRAVLIITPSDTTYQSLLYAGAALPDWVKSVHIQSASDVRVAHWGPSDGDAIGTVAVYQIVPGGDAGGTIGRRDGLPVFLSAAVGVVVEVIASAMAVQ